MNYFEQYEKIKEAKTNLTPGTVWEVIESSSYLGSTNLVGARVRIKNLINNCVHYSYYRGHIISHLEYERPIEVFTRTFRPILQ